ncbi:hypothetical protein Pyn_38353 [Prunus yedoensis var. nudiflora]|uniref:Uncharacterized protein n=1 Tax=Prunus yedoensis var. nudiflora TaxID=2094558 RepID=A0A314ZPM4_PRUYE|nr:hypothetical protein Pyn_38353 [Prunus yedoensis var. nudiflora]
MPRPTLAASASAQPSISTTFAMPSMPRTLLSHHYQQQPFNFCNYVNGGSPTANASGTGFHRERRFCTPATGSAMLTDHGLLQDIVPSHMLKQE